MLWQLYMVKWLSVWFMVATLYITSDVSESFLSSQSHKPFESESSQSYPKFFRVESESESWLGRLESESSHENCRVTSSHWFASSSQCRVTRNFTYFLRHFFALKWRPTCYEMAPDKLENGPNVVLTSLTAGYLYLSSLSLHFACLFHTQSCQRVYPNLSASVAASQLALCWMCDSLRMVCAWWTTPVWREQAEIKLARRGIFIVAWCHSVKVCALAALPFHSQQSGAWTRMWRWYQIQPSQKECAIGAVYWKTRRMLLQPLGWRCIESVVFTCPIHENDQRWTCTRI